MKDLLEGLPPSIRDWLEPTLPPGWETLVDNAPRAIETTPDFNTKPLNGEDPDDIRKTFGVEVRILGKRDTPPHSISIHGPNAAVCRYERHLMQTWPGSKLV